MDSWNFTKPTRAILLAAGAAAVFVGPHFASAAAINVLTSQPNLTLAGDTTGASGNNGINPATYTPATVAIPYATNAITGLPVTYDAADVTDTGTMWNTLLGPANTVSNTSGSNITTLYQSALPLVDSAGSSTGVTLDMSFTENTGKNDKPYIAGISAANTDGLTTNPNALMSSSLFNNGLVESISFTLHGLTAGANYNLYIYGAGSGLGYGGTYTLAAANQPAGYAAVTTDSDDTTAKTKIHRSVFDATGIDPIPERGLSWVLLPAVVDSGGNLTFNLVADVATNNKGSINGFQLDSVPEPTSLALLGLGAMKMVSRRRRSM